VNTSDSLAHGVLKPMKLLPRWCLCDRLADRDNHVGSAELQRRLSNFLAASAERNGGGNDGGDDNNAFQTLHGLLSSGSTALQPSTYVATDPTLFDQGDSPTSAAFVGFMVPKCNAIHRVPILKKALLSKAQFEVLPGFSTGLCLI
jgi:hypothetical protein